MNDEIRPRVIISRVAKMDIKVAARWYDDHVPRLGAKFLAAVDEAVAQVRQFPESGPLLYRTLRGVLLQTFPYTLLYVYDPGRVRVVGVIHWRRDPEVWQVRAD